LQLVLGFNTSAGEQVASWQGRLCLQDAQHDGAERWSRTDLRGSSRILAMARLN
jgi:hypothetical protein